MLIASDDAGGAATTRQVVPGQAWPDLATALRLVSANIDIKEAISTT